MKVPLVGLDRRGADEAVADLGLKGYQVSELLRWVYARRNLDPMSWSNIPKVARASMAEIFEAGLPEVLGEKAAGDGTRKFLLGLRDGRRIEAVYIPDGERRTVCLSSQVGCAIGCPFCLTGKMGLSRNLTAGEILGQLFVLEKHTDIVDLAYNVVFMGMGEPLANLPNLTAALALMEDPGLMAISRRRITVSTAGLADALEEFSKSPLCPQTAISFGSPNDAVRDSLIPVNRRFPLKRIRETLQRLSRAGRERISLEYTLLCGVNDSERDALGLARFAKGLKVKVNLIQFNPVESLPYSPSSEEALSRFRKVLAGSGLPVSVRHSRGSEISAACGQLALDGWPSD